MVGVPETTLARLVAAGIVLSIVGDAALLGAGNGAFMVGLAAFLLAHVAYVIAFVGVAVWSPHLLAVTLAAAASTTLILRAIWRGASGLRAADGRLRPRHQRDGRLRRGDAWRAARCWRRSPPPGRCCSMRRTPAWPSTASGAPCPHAALATMGVYWLGQIGIAVAAAASWVLRTVGRSGRSARGQMRAIAASHMRKKRIRSSSGFIQPTVMQ